MSYPTKIDKAATDGGMMLADPLTAATANPVLEGVYPILSVCENIMSYPTKIDEAATGDVDAPIAKWSGFTVGLGVSQERLDKLWAAGIISQQLAKCGKTADEVSFRLDELNQRVFAGDYTEAEAYALTRHIHLLRVALSEHINANS